MSKLQFYSLKVAQFPLFRFGPGERYEDVLENGHEVLSESKKMTFVWRECGMCDDVYPEFRKTYSSDHPWTVGNVVSHIYKLIDEYLIFHHEDDDFFVDMSISGFEYSPEKEEIRIVDQR